MTFEECLLECGKNAEMVKQFDRLRGTNLQLKGSPLELAVDDASGRLQSDVTLFSAFVYEYIWLSLVAKEKLC